MRNLTLKSLALALIAALTLGQPTPAHALIIFSTDTTQNFSAEGITLDSDGAGAVNTAITFGNDVTTSENGVIQWNVSSNTFGIDHSTSITGSISADAGATLSGGTANINVNSNNNTNINTGTSNGAVSIGGGSGTLAINTTNWDISSAGAASGLTGLSSSGTVSFTAGMSASGGTINLNDSSNSAVNINTGTSTGALTLGGGSGTIAINSSDWDISTTGDMTNIGAITMDGLLTGTAGATVSGAALNFNASSNFAVNIATGTSTGTVTIGGSAAQTIDIGSGAAAKTVTLGSTNTTSTTTINSGSNGVNINANNNQPTNINTGTSTGALTLGGGSGTIAINSSDWDITTVGNMTGIGTINADGLFTGTAGATISGAAINLNASSNFATNINTGTSTGAVTIGGNSNTFAVDATNFDLTTAGAMTLTGHLTLSGDASEGLSGGGLTDCDAANQSLQWDTTTNKFSCTTAGNDTGIFTDTNPAAFADNNTTELFNDATVPNITTDSTSSTVLVNFGVQGTSADGDDESFVISIARTTNGTDPVCGTSTQVGNLQNTFKSDVGAWGISGAFMDAPGVAGDIRYQVCTNSNTVVVGGGDLDTTVNSVTVGLVELGN